MLWWKRLKKATAEDDERFRQTMEDNKVGFKDGFAIILSAFLVIVLPCLLVLLAFGALCLLLIGAF